MLSPFCCLCSPARHPDLVTSSWLSGSLPFYQLVLGFMRSLLYRPNLVLVSHPVEHPDMPLIDPPCVLCLSSRVHRRQLDEIQHSLHAGYRDDIL